MYKGADVVAKNSYQISFNEAYEKLDGIKNNSTIISLFLDSEDVPHVTVIGTLNSVVFNENIEGVGDVINFSVDETIFEFIENEYTIEHSEDSMFIQSKKAPLYAILNAQELSQPKLKLVSSRKEEVNET